MNAAEKINATAVAMRDPDDDAGGPELAIAGITQLLSTPEAKAWIDKAQQDGGLDQFVTVLGRWLIGHRSDEAPLIVCLEVPGQEAQFEQLGAGVILHRVREARELALDPPSLAEMMQAGDSPD